MASSTRFLAGGEVAERIRGAFPQAVVEASDGWVRLAPDAIVDVGRFLRDERAIDARFLNNVSGVDRRDRFEIVYHLSSLSHNHTFALKVEVDREEAEVPSVEPVWQGAHLQEREIFDLMGIRFQGHPSMKRMFLWEGFPGYPLRKDFKHMPSGESPGLRRFPKEEEGAWGGEFRGD